MADSANESLHPLVNKVLDSKPPIAKLIDFEVERVALGHAIAVLEAGPQHANPMGTLHGGVLCDVADAAMGIAFASTLEHDESFTTMNLAINFFRPVWNDRLRAEARVINRGKNVGYVECEITRVMGNRSRKQLQHAACCGENGPNNDSSLLGAPTLTYCASNPEFEKLLQNMRGGGLIEEDEWRRYVQFIPGGVQELAGK